MESQVKDRWEQLVQAYSASHPNARYDELVAAFVQGGPAVLETLRRNLQEGKRSIAVSVCGRLSESDLAQLLRELVFLASWDNGMTAEVRRLIRSVASGRLPEIKRLVEAQLAREDNDDETYLRFLELYQEIDLGLMRELAIRAAQDKNPWIREAGQNAMAWLDAKDRND